MLFRSLLMAGVLALGSPLPVAAQSRTAQAAPDRIDLVGLTTRQPDPAAPPTQVEFQATVNYRLESAANGIVLLFLFENSAGDSSQQSSGSIAVQRGSGQLVLNIDYELRPAVRTLTLVAGLFRTEQKLLAWVSTNPIDMAPWPGRLAFEKAMAARLNNDFVTAEQQLTVAIGEAPETGNYYYWRADTRVRLNNFEDALADFNHSIEFMPLDRPSRVGRGISRLWLGQSQGAIEDLSFVIDSGQAPDRVTAWAHRARGLAHAAQGEGQDAVVDYAAYLQLLPDAADRAQVQDWIAAIRSGGN
jgi:hypothetical protein